jgi:Tfp pilus assembly protein PilZ
MVANTQNKKTPAKTQLLRLINSMSEAQCQKFLKRIKTWRRNKDRREDPRIACAIPVDYSVEGRVFKDFIHDISAGGLFIKTQASLSAGQDITLTFMPPEGKKPVRIDGKIERSDARGIGVKFKNKKIAPSASPPLKSIKKAKKLAKDRRIGPRLDFHCPVLIQGIEGEFTITDISLEGAFIECDNATQSQFKTGQMLHLLIRLPTEDNPTEIKASIANVRAHGVGCRFIGLSKISKDAIHRCFNVAKHSIPLS